jgi:predicted flap endonuclease-1-like 5' DNA nuclease
LSRTWVGGIRAPNAPPLDHPQAEGALIAPPTDTVAVASTQPAIATVPSPALPAPGSRPPPRRTDGPGGWPVAPITHRPTGESDQPVSGGSWHATPSEPAIPRAPAVPTRVEPGTHDSHRPAHAPVSSPGLSSPGSSPGELDDLRRTLQSRNTKIEALSSQRDTLRSRVESIERDLEKKEQELDRLHRQHESLRSLVAVRADRIRELELAAGHKNATIEAHERTIAALRSQLADDEKVLASRPTEHDTLTRIKGIGPKYAEKLNAMGIVNFRQIAAWSDEDIERIATDLGARAKRIHRDGWRESAAALVAERDAAKDEVDQGW